MSANPGAWNEKLDPLDVVYCRFPHEGRLNPAPKPRPALVLNVNDAAVPQRVEVAFGTSQRTDDKYAGEFELSPKDGTAFKRAGLTERTKFHLGRTAWLPYNARWFKPRPSEPRTATPKLGTLDVRASKAIERRFVAAAAAAGLLEHGRSAVDDMKIPE